MAIVNQVEKRVKLSLDQIVEYQLLTHCFLSNITLSVADLKCLTMLALDREQELNTFCNKVHQSGIFKSAQSVRNAIIKAERNNLIVKEGKSKKKIYINPDLRVQVEVNVLLDYKFLSVASQ